MRIFSQRDQKIVKCDEYKEYPCDKTECPHTNHCLIYPNVGRVKVEFT